MTTLMQCSKRSGRAAIVALLLLNGCATTPAASFRVPFQYPGSGVGGALMTQALTVPMGRESEIASRAISSALAQMNLSTSAPVAMGLPANRQILTDTSPVEPQIIAQYNESVSRNPAMQLATNRSYGLQLQFSYAIQHKEFIFEVHPRLFERGTGSAEWLPYRGDYNGPFFAAQFGDRVKVELSKQATGGS